MDFSDEFRNTRRKVEERGGGGGGEGEREKEREVIYRAAPKAAGSLLFAEQIAIARF